MQELHLLRALACATLVPQVLLHNLALADIPHAVRLCSDANTETYAFFAEPVCNCVISPKRQPKTMATDEVAFHGQRWMQVFVHLQCSAMGFDRNMLGLQQRLNRLH